jgi:hypothetical protein
MKIFFFKKSKIGHGGSPRNRIPQGTTVTEFSKTFPVFYKWPDLTDLQVALTSTVSLVYRFRGLWSTEFRSLAYRIHVILRKCSRTAAVSLSTLLNLVLPR